MSAPATWLVELTVPAAAEPRFVEALERFSDTVSSFEAEGGKARRLAAYLAPRPDEAALLAGLAQAASECGLAPPAPKVRRLAERDWAAESQRGLLPISAGRYFVRGLEYAGRAPPGAIVLGLDAGPAFGTGHHESTRGCLLALDRLARRQRVRRALDVGCGSGILAIAMARTWRRPVLAVDNDAVAVGVSRANARDNGAAPWLRAIWADGVGGRQVRRGAPYDLMTANILSGPLIAMARDLARLLAPGGALVLSGLLAEQAAGVLAAYRRQDLRLAERLELGDWVTLILRRGPNKGGGSSVSRRLLSVRDVGPVIRRPRAGGSGWPPRADRRRSGPRRAARRGSGRYP